MYPIRVIIQSRTKAKTRIKPLALQTHPEVLSVQDSSGSKACQHLQSVTLSPKPPFTPGLDEANHQESSCRCLQGSAGAAASRGRGGIRAHPDQAAGGLAGPAGCSTSSFSTHCSNEVLRHRAREGTMGGGLLPRVLLAQCYSEERPLVRSRSPLCTLWFCTGDSVTSTPAKLLSYAL